MLHAREREYEALEGLCRARELEHRAVGQVLAAEAAFFALLPDGMGALGILPRELRRKTDLMAAREGFRAADRKAMAARDEVAGIACDLESGAVKTS